MVEKHILTGVGGAVVGVFAGIGLGGSGTEGKINAGLKRAFAPVEEITATLDQRMGALEEAAAANASALSEAMSSGNDALAARIDGIEALLGNLEGGLSDSLSAATAEQTAALQAGLDALKAGLGTDTGGGAAQEEEAASDTDPENMIDGLKAGETAIFGDTRVFVSLADEAGGQARLAVNGALTTLSVGESYQTDAGCPVTLEGVEGAQVAVSSDCGGPAKSAAAGSAVPSDAGEPVDGAAPGETVLLEDGALRVFVSSVMGDQGARLAINGVEMVTVSAGESVEVEAGEQGCTVTVEATGGGRAAVDGSCGS